MKTIRSSTFGCTGGRKVRSAAGITSPHPLNDTSNPPIELTALAREFDAVLGSGSRICHPGDLDLKQADVTVTDADIDALITERTSARRDRDFTRSDDLLAQLSELRVKVEDHPDGTTSWRWT